ncbi:MAG: hypothetical protein JXR63_07745 [Spirochaetales bacterium]|nr:hypothetical protein [Spirochaetales bacterium]
MQIYFNNELVDYSVEEEKNLIDIIKNTISFLDDHNLVTAEIIVNGNSYIPQANEAFDNMSIEEIEKINFKLISKSDYKLAELSYLKEAVLDILTAIGEEDKKTLINFNYNSTVDDIELFLNIKCEDLLTLIDETQVFKGNLANEKLPLLINIFNFIVEIINKRIHEMQNPEDEFNHALSSLSAMIPEIEQISIQMQTGESTKAINTILKFVEDTEKCVRLSSEVKKSNAYQNKSVDLKDFFTNLNVKLLELVEAFKNEDSILIGDIFEYEISPVLEQITKIIDNK